MITTRHAVDALSDTATIADHAAWGRRHGRLHPATLAATDGLRGLRTASSHDGAAGSAADVVTAAAELAGVDAAAAWVLGEHWTASWIAGLFPDATARRVLGDGPVCGTLAPTGSLVSSLPGAPAGHGEGDSAGGGELFGMWDAVCGAGAARWHVAVAVRTTGHGHPEPVVVAVETSELRLRESPTEPGPGAEGLRGAGRARLVANGVPVPADRVVALVDVLDGRPGTGLHSAPLVPVAGLPIAGALVGLGRAALDTVSGEHPSDALAPAAARLDRADSATAALAAAVDDRTDRRWTRTERAAARAGLDAVVHLVHGAVTHLAAAAPHLPRLVEILHDVQAVDRFGDARDRVPDRYARALCGLHL